jgi:hypothetical protein
VHGHSAVVFIARDVAQRTQAEEALHEDGRAGAVQ